MDKRELADFLRSRRERLQPADVGLPAGQRRRTPGLRRDEVAHLAYISTDYYTRLEQTRGPRPSRRVLVSIARALRLSAAESRHLFHLAGEAPDPAAGPPGAVPPSILALLHRLPTAAALVLDAKFDVLAWNPLAAALLEDFSTLPPRERNLIRRHFLAGGVVAAHYGQKGGEEFGAFAAAHLRAAAARYPDDPGVAALVADLVAGSNEFAQLWDTHQVENGQHLSKTMQHPVVGELTLNCDALTVTATDQQVVIFTADPGTPSEQALQLLEVIGLQRMDSAG